ncbi:MAG: tRNA (adenosine(37)-N6)-threonylcarbamoyltransferase complex dimerization subunit type 1 TsaB [Hoeflea sp.]|uniref:tRNA (adenosine(37)-N6)-threonylcarbamoyltransferase complex dimerization subunit type 1 TsaB n=1 Tax=Hoeflea sp. TaxID=1940281 RepID=UPI0032EEBC67
MLTLAIDCSAALCAAAVHESTEDRVLADQSPAIGRGHAERLPGVVGTVMQAAGLQLQDIDRIGVTIGPGSFAGIRVGVAFARGLALTLGSRAVGVGSLDALAVPAARSRGRTVMAALDARRDRLWTLVAAADGQVLHPGAELTPEAAADLAADVGCDILGSGGAILAAIRPELCSSVIGDGVAPEIGDVARLAARLDADASPPEPLYLREADARPQSGFALPHEA